MKSHAYLASQIDITKCAKCARPESDHSNQAVCEACSNIGECDLLGTILLCNSCMKKEYEIAIAHMREHSAKFDEARINTAITNPIGAILKSIEIDTSVKVSEDYFNAETTSIQELKSACGDNHFELAKLIQQRFNHFKSVLFDLDAARVNLNSRQRAQAIYLNDLAAKLTEEQRQEIKLKDLSYQPKEPPKKAATPRVKLTIEEKMAQNLVAAKLGKIAQELVDNKTCKDIEEAKKVAAARGLIMKIEDARIIVARQLGLINKG
jgi:hypothetical protein